METQLADLHVRIYIQEKGAGQCIKNECLNTQFVYVTEESLSRLCGGTIPSNRMYLIVDESSNQFELHNPVLTEKHCVHEMTVGCTIQPWGGGMGEKERVIE